MKLCQQYYQILGKTFFFFCNTAALSHQCNTVLAESTEQSQWLHTDVLHGVGLLRICVCVHTYTHTCICMGVCMYMYVCIYICIYMLPGQREPLVQFQCSALCRQAGSRHGPWVSVTSTALTASRVQTLWHKKKNLMQIIRLLFRSSCALKAVSYPLHVHANLGEW